MEILATDRLLLRELTIKDASFIFRLVNEPTWLEHIGDKNVRSVDDAQRYILEGPVDSYKANGYGLYLVVLKPTDTPIGLCGLVKRDELAHADIGFALLPGYAGMGYGYESARR